jgi:hypothetical protein
VKEEVNHPTKGAIYTMLWMEAILHHLGWLKPYKSWDKLTTYQLVQEFFRPP